MMCPARGPRLALRVRAVRALRTPSDEAGEKVSLTSLAQSNGKKLYPITAPIASLALLRGMGYCPLHLRRQSPGPRHIATLTNLCSHFCQSTTQGIAKQLVSFGNF